MRFEVWCCFGGRCCVASLRALALTISLLACGNAVFAQQSIDYASLGGRVTDPSEAVVPGAQVVVRHTQTNVTAAAVTDQDGRFRFPYLRDRARTKSPSVSRDSRMRRVS